MQRSPRDNIWTLERQQEMLRERELEQPDDEVPEEEWGYEVDEEIDERELQERG